MTTTPDAETTNRLGRMIGGFGHQVAAHWPAVDGDNTLWALAEDVSLLLDDLAAGHDVAGVLAALDRDLARLPVLDGGAP